jgi:hypothetical protein
MDKIALVITRDAIAHLQGCCSRASSKTIKSHSGSPPRGCVKSKSIDNRLVIIRDALEYNLLYKVIAPVT